MAIRTFLQNVPLALAAFREASAASITFNKTTTYQTIEGFGFSEAFTFGRSLMTMSNEPQRSVLDLLQSTERGAGLTILRNIVTSTNSDMSVAADAWSAPSYMRTIMDDTYVGCICGVTGVSCSLGDWRQGFANYLVQYVRFYKEEVGVDITHLGFLNVPEAADFLKVLKPTLEASEFASVKVTCCDGMGWDPQQQMLTDIQSVDAERFMDFVSPHGYSSAPGTPFSRSLPIWQTEWADILARDNSMLIRVNPDEDSYEVSKRLWAFAHFGRFVRPGAVRISAFSDSESLTASAFINSDGSFSLQVINLATSI
ncbi:glycoside hydrolase family 30 protein [Ilyonectria destructans]|nr:glycoside hydrolase family 30 protein [Ilyonectria destructans]